jgi:hypothetical protein
MNRFTNENELASPSSALAALARRTGAGDANDAADLVLATMRKTTDATTLRHLTYGLSTMFERMEKKEAAARAAQAVELLLPAITRTANAGDLRSLTEGLSWMLAVLDAKEAKAPAGRAAALSRR